MIIIIIIIIIILVIIIIYMRRLVADGHKHQNEKVEKIDFKV